MGDQTELMEACDKHLEARSRRVATRCVIARNAVALRSTAPSLPSRLVSYNSARNRPFGTVSGSQDAIPRDNNDHIDVEQLLAKPTWSVASLLPPKDQQADSPQISPKQLHHLLRLSALPPPKDAEEEAKMLSTLSSQLHFVKDIQNVDTTGVEPLRSLRDETSVGEREAELGMEALKGALGNEEVRGKHHKRIRRRRDVQVGPQEEAWDVLAAAGKKVGRFFVVEGGKDG